MSPQIGEWYLPNAAAMIGENSSATMYYISRGDNGEVILNRPSNVTSPSGQFCCKVPNRFRIIQTLCVTLSKLYHVYQYLLL